MRPGAKNPMKGCRQLTGWHNQTPLQAAALFVLADLGHLEFAIALLDDIWPRGEISSSAACELLTRCFRSDDDFLVLDAAITLQENAARLSEVGCFVWPSLAGRPTDMPEQARMHLLDALLTCLTSQRADEWSRECLGAFVERLVRIKNDDKSTLLRNSSILSLDGLLRHPEFDTVAEIVLPGENLHVNELRVEVSGLAKEVGSAAYSHLARAATNLGNWIDESYPDEPPPAVVDGASR